MTERMDIDGMEEENISNTSSNPSFLPPPTQIDSSSLKTKSSNYRGSLNYSTRTTASEYLDKVLKRRRMSKKKKQNKNKKKNKKKKSKNQASGKNSRPNLSKSDSDTVDSLSASLNSDSNFNQIDRVDGDHL